MVQTGGVYCWSDRPSLWCVCDQVCLWLADGCAMTAGRPRCRSSSSGSVGGVGVCVCEKGARIKVQKFQPPPDTVCECSLVMLKPSHTSKCQLLTPLSQTGTVTEHELFSADARMCSDLGRAKLVQRD